VTAECFFLIAQEGDTVTVVVPGRKPLFGFVHSINAQRTVACLDNLADACPYALLLEVDGRRGTEFTIHPHVVGAL
jgi:hypothetical protein